MSVGITRVAYVNVCRQRDRLLRAARRVIKMAADDGPNHVVIHNHDLAKLKRAIELSVTKPHITATGRKILDGFKRART